MAQAPPPVPLRQTNLLDLPTELLSKIAWELAPLGGQQAGSLRSVNHHLAGIASPVVFSSILISGSPDENNELLAALWTNDLRIRDVATSLHWAELDDEPSLMAGAAIRSLVNLRRLSFKGEGDLPVSLTDTLRHLPHLHTLSIESFSIDTSNNDAPGPHYQLDLWAPTIRHLTLVDVQGYDLFMSLEGRASYHYEPVNLHSISIRSIEDRGADEDSVVAVLALAAGAATLRHAVFQSQEAESSWADSKLLGTCLSSDARTLELRGLHSLFNDNRAEWDDTATFVAGVLLPWVGLSQLPELSLPIRDRFKVHPAFAVLRMPHLRKLSLSSSPTDVYAPRSADFLSAVTFTTLSAFLSEKNGTFPALKTLRLVGWLDKSNAAKLATLTPSQLVVRRIYVFGLLGLLKLRGVEKLVLENSAGHPEPGKSCVFEREEEGDWRVSLTHL